MKKRILSLILAFAMAATLAPATALVGTSVSKAATLSFDTIEASKNSGSGQASWTMGSETGADADNARKITVTKSSLGVGGKVIIDVASKKTSVTPAENDTYVVKASVSNIASKVSAGVTIKSGDDNKTVTVPAPSGSYSAGDAITSTLELTVPDAATADSENRVVIETGTAKFYIDVVVKGNTPTVTNYKFDEWNSTGVVLPAGFGVGSDLNEFVINIPYGTKPKLVFTPPVDGYTPTPVEVSYNRTSGTQATNVDISKEAIDSEGEILLANKSGNTIYAPFTATASAYTYKVIKATDAAARVTLDKSAAYFGDTIKASYTGSDAAGAVIYQWQKATASNPVDGDFSNIGGATTNSLAVNDVNYVDTWVRCVVTPATGYNVVKSSAIKISKRVLSTADFKYGSGQVSQATFSTNITDPATVTLIDSIARGTITVNWGYLAPGTSLMQANGTTTNVVANTLITTVVNKAASYGVYVTSIKGTDANGYVLSTQTSPATLTVPLKVGTFVVNKATYSNLWSANITGALVVGEELTVGTQTGAVAYTPEAYQWYRGTTAIEGATKNKYTLKAADVGSIISCRVSESNYSGYLEGKTQAVIAKKTVSIPNAFAEYVHFSANGKAYIDLREELKEYGTASANVTANVTGSSVASNVTYNASTGCIEITFGANAPAVDTQISIANMELDFPGHKVTMSGLATATVNDVRKVVIEPIEDKEYDGTPATTTAKAYLNDKEVAEVTPVITYSPAKSGNVDSYIVTASWNFTGAGVSAVYTDSTYYDIYARELVATNIASNYNVGDYVPVTKNVSYNLVAGDGARVEISVWNAKTGGTQVTTEKFDQAGTYWVRFNMAAGSPAVASTNYELPETMQITVGGGQDEIEKEEEKDPIKKELEKAQELLDQGYVLRVFNPIDGNHYYYTTISELETLLKIGCKHEIDRTAQFKASNTKTDAFDRAVYRLSTKNAGGAIHYTADATERDNLVKLGWTWDKANYNAEGAIFYVSGNSDNAKIYRLRNGKMHHFALQKERDYLIKKNIGWVDETVNLVADKVWYNAN